MKPTTALFMFSLTVAGAACSGPVAGAEAAEAVQTAAAETEVQGTLNLNIGQAPAPSGGLNFGTSPAGNAGGLIVAPGSTGATFEDVGDLGIDIELTPDTVLEPAAPSDEDDIVRLPQKN